MLSLTLKEVENFIKKYRKLKVRLKVLKDELDSIEETGVSAIKFNFTKNKTNNINRPVEYQAIKNINNKKKLEKEIFIIKKQVHIIESVLECLDKLERQVIVNKLINNKNYNDISIKLSISEIYAKKLKRKSLIKIKKIIS